MDCSCCGYSFYWWVRPAARRVNRLGTKVKGNFDAKSNRADQGEYHAEINSVLIAHAANDARNGAPIGWTHRPKKCLPSTHASAGPADGTELGKPTTKLPFPHLISPGQHPDDTSPDNVVVLISCHKHNGVCKQPRARCSVP